MTGARGRLIPLLLAGGLVLAGCSQDVGAGDRVSAGASDQGISDEGYTSPDGATTIVARSEREAAPDLRGDTLAGKEFALSDHLGSVVVLNIWASWCPPCRAESPTLEKVSQSLAKQGVQFVGLNLKDDPAAARAFVDKAGISYPSIVDPDGSKLLGLSASLPPTSLPATLVIDREGRIASRALGAVDESRLRGMIEPVLAETTPSAGTGTPPESS